MDWRLLQRNYPAITPIALIDTLRLARHLKLGTKNSLAALISQLDLTTQIRRLVPGSEPHRALWDAVAVALLLPALIARGWPSGISLADLLGIAAIDAATSNRGTAAKPVGQDTLFDSAT